MITNIRTGLTKNPRITADEISEKSGLDVYVPDLFNGDPIPSAILKDVPEKPGEKISFGKKVNSQRHIGQRKINDFDVF